MNWEELKFWDSGEWQVIQERIEDLPRLCPQKENLFAALDAVELEDVKVAIIGQDPYPELRYATGIAFSIPKRAKAFPKSLQVIFQEYNNDLHYQVPTSGDLSPWCKEGVLLWNAVPSCVEGEPLAHNKWPEWPFLTEELIRVLDGKGIVFAFLGRFAQRYERVVQNPLSVAIRTAHPAAEAYQRHVNTSFSGSRFFTTVNDKLRSLGKQPINWRL